MNLIKTQAYITVFWLPFFYFKFLQSVKHQASFQLKASYSQIFACSSINLAGFSCSLITCPKHILRLHHRLSSLDKICGAETSQLLRAQKLLERRNRGRLRLETPLCLPRLGASWRLRGLWADVRHREQSQGEELGWEVEHWEVKSGFEGLLSRTVPPCWQNAVPVCSPQTHQQRQLLLHLLQTETCFGSVSCNFKHKRFQLPG